MTLSGLEEEAQKRKERLAQWKITKQNQTIKRKEYEEDEENETDKKDLQEETIEFPKPIFRNYKPSDSGHLSGAIILPKPKLIDVKSLVRIYYYCYFNLLLLLFRLMNNLNQKHKKMRIQ